VRGAARPSAWCLALLALLGVLYGLTLYPGVGGRVNAGDSAKFQYVGKVLGVPHPPGYPQYVLLNHLWTRLPLGLELATQVNLLSAMLATAAGGALFVALRRLTASDFAAALGTATVLLSRPVWTYATEAEVHALHLLYVAALLWAAERWRARRTTGWRFAVVALFAAGCGNHPLMVAFLPGLLLLFGSDWRASLQPRFLVAALLALCLGAAQYGYLLWSAHTDTPLLEALPRNADGSDLLLAMSGFRFASQRLEAELPVAQARLLDIGRAAVLQLPGISLVLLPFGTWALWRRDRILAGFALLTLGAGIALLLIYRIRDWGPYLGPVWLWTIAVAVTGLGEFSARHRRICIALWLGQLVFLGAGNWHRLHLVQSPYDRTRLIATAGPGAAVLAYPGGNYRDAELARYYSLGLGLSQVMTARVALEEQWLFLGRQALVFTSPRVRALVDAYRIDYIGRPEPALQPPTLYTSGTDWPVEALQVVPEGGGASVRRPEGDLLAEVRRPLQVLVVGGEERRVKGVVSWPLRTTFERREALADVPRFLEHALPEDFICVLLQGEPRLGDLYGLRELVRDVLALPAEALDARVAVVAGRAGSRQLHLDPAAPLSLRIAP
jgi:hypothetical protein